MSADNIFDEAITNLIMLGFVNRYIGEDGQEMFEITDVGAAYYEMISEGKLVN